MYLLDGNICYVLNDLTLFIFLICIVSHSMAQHGAMKFVGKASFSVLTTTVNVESDTLVYSGSDFTIPSMTYNMSGYETTIPSFTIKETSYEGGYTGVTWNEQDFTATATDFLLPLPFLNLRKQQLRPS